MSHARRRFPARHPSWSGSRFWHGGGECSIVRARALIALNGRTGIVVVFGRLAGPERYFPTEPAVNEPSARHPGFLARPLAALGRLSTTRGNGLAGLVCDSAVSALLLGTGLLRADLGGGAALALIAAGLLLFSFIEYCFHRWLFHGPAGMLENGHSKHHEDPAGYDALPFFVPPLGMLALAALLALLLPATVALLLVGAFAAGYAAYGVGHTAIHTRSLSRVLPRRWAAAHHIHHHHPDHNFGVTSPLWDIVLGTRYVSRGAAEAGARRP